MSNRIVIKRSSEANKIPSTSDIVAGELAINLTDQKLYSSNGSSVFQIGGVASDIYEVTSPSNEWTINHNKGYYPRVTVFDLFNRVVLVEIYHVNINQVKIILSSPQSGIVVIN